MNGRNCAPGTAVDDEITMFSHWRGKRREPVHQPLYYSVPGPARITVIAPAEATPPLSVLVIVYLSAADAALRPNGS